MQNIVNSLSNALCQVYPGVFTTVAHDREVVVENGQLTVSGEAIDDGFWVVSGFTNLGTMSSGCINNIFYFRDNTADHFGRKDFPVTQICKVQKPNVLLAENEQNCRVIMADPGYRDNKCIVYLSNIERINELSKRNELTQSCVMDMNYIYGIVFHGKIGGTITHDELMAVCAFSKDHDDANRNYLEFSRYLGSGYMNDKYYVEYEYISQVDNIDTDSVRDLLFKNDIIDLGVTGG